MAIAETLQRLKLTVPHEKRALADLVEVVQVAARDATTAVAPRLQYEETPHIAVKAIDDGKLALTVRVPLAVTATVEQSYVVGTDGLVLPTSGTT